MQGKPIVADQETYEEKKLKMQKAMGEKLGEAADADAEQRRQNLLKQALAAPCAAAH